MTVVLMRELPSGTDGGLMAVANTPAARSSREAVSAFSALPAATGMMGVAEMPILMPWE